MSRKSYQSVSTSNDSFGDTGTASESGYKQAVIYLDENGNECKEPRIRKIVSSQAKHVTVVSYSRKQKESHKHTSHFVTSVR